jgi:hypothetical protein
VPVLPYDPPNVRLIRPKRLPQGIRDAGVALVEPKLGNSTVKDLVSITDEDWHVACRRFNATLQLAKYRGRPRSIHRDDVRCHGPNRASLAGDLPQES